MIINNFGTEYELTFYTDKYCNNNSLYVGAMGKCSEDEWEEPYCDVTVNLPRSGIIQNERAAFLDMNNSGNVITKMIEEGYIEIVDGMEERSGFCVYPLGIFTDKFWNEVK
jgi:hypothetical protein